MMTIDIDYDKLTIVTGVSNGKYLKKYERGLRHWFEDPLLENTKILVFAHKDIYDICKKITDKYKNNYKNIELVEWSKDNCQNIKEEMLSAFILEVPKRVKTKYWIKFDCDNQLKERQVELPDNWESYCVVATKWGYTKCKADNELAEKGHWLNRLDTFCDKVPDFASTKSIFPKNIKDNRYGHKRYCSFFALYRTNFTKHIADILNKYNEGNMVIPSEDTTTWYFVTRLPGKRKVYYGRYRNYLNPR